MSEKNGKTEEKDGIPAELLKALGKKQVTSNLPLKIHFLFAVFTCKFTC